jgi:L-alanine-DL-glutamate epimerase-like enolase superfamily enzyme
MKITSLSIKKITIPFKVSFKHASAERATTQSIWVEAVSENGTIGYGEGCPREYVTNESLESSFEFFNHHKAALQKSIDNVSSLEQWAQENKVAIDESPAAWCAIELALLDLIAKENELSIEEVLNVSPIEIPFQYSAVLGDSKLEVFKAQVERYVEMGFTDFKIKISGNLEKDNEKLSFLKEISQKQIRVRLDANNLWKDVNSVIEYLKSLQYPVFAIEEPLTAGQYEELKKIGNECNVKIILDESFLKVEDFKNIKGDASKWIINLRVSKMGGLFRSLSIIEKAKALGIGVIVGAQVGETSLLTRAALTIANSCRDILIAQEGAFGTLLLEKDVCDPPLMFREKGLLNFEPTVPYGFQLNLNVTKI